MTYRPPCPRAIHQVYEELPLVAFTAVTYDHRYVMLRYTGRCGICSTRLHHRGEVRRSA